MKLPPLFVLLASTLQPAFAAAIPVRVATVVGIIFIPALFVLFQRLREWGHRLTG